MAMKTYNLKLIQQEARFKKDPLLQNMRSLAETQINIILSVSNVYGSNIEKIEELTILYDECVHTLVSLMHKYTGVNYTEIYNHMKLTQFELKVMFSNKPYQVSMLLREQLKKCYMMAYSILTEAGY